MDDLIEALQIFRKYGNPYAPLHCTHDDLLVVDYDPEKMSQEDINRLEELSFTWNGEYFHSYRFGSA